MRALGALVLALTMLTRSEAAGLADQRLGPKERAIIGSVAANRVAILQKLNYAVYTSTTGGSIIIATFTMPGNTLAPGDQFHVIVSGSTDTNNNVVGAFVRIVQGSTFQDIGTPTTAGSPGVVPVAWRSDIQFAANIPGAQGQYSPPIASSALQVTTPNLSRNLPNSAIGFAGSGMTLMTDTALTAGSFAGGHIVPAATPGPSAMVATRQPFVFENSQPMQFNIVLYGPAVGATVTVQAGYLQGM